MSAPSKIRLHDMVSSQGELCPHRAFTGSMRDVEYDQERAQAPRGSRFLASSKIGHVGDARPGRACARAKNTESPRNRSPIASGASTRAESQTEAEVEAPAARTLADARAKAATGTTVAGEAAVEGCRVISGSSATNSLQEIKDDAEF
jgi:hypothetical protein